MAAMPTTSEELKGPATPVIQETNMPDRAIGTSPQLYAKVAGLIWLIVAIMAPFAEFFVRQGLIVPGNVAATADNIVASQSLFRAGFASDLVVFVIEVALAAVLYVLFRPVSPILALVMSFARLAMVTILGLQPAQHVYRAAAADRSRVRSRVRSGTAAKPWRTSS